MLLGLGDEDIETHVPWVQGRGRWCPEDGRVDVAALLASYLRGRDVRLGSALRRCVSTEDALALETDHGQLHARCLVNTADS